MAACRCVHDVHWYRVCPWCVTEAEAATYRAVAPGRYAFWRNLTPAQVAEETAAQIRFAALRSMLSSRLWPD